MMHESGYIKRKLIRLTDKHLLNIKYGI